MDHVRRNDAPVQSFPGREVSLIIGKGGKFMDKAALWSSDGISAGFGTFSPRHGPMDNHYHVVGHEYMYVIAAQDAFVRYGASKDEMNETADLKAGDIICPSVGEWHGFGFTSSRGYLDTFNFFPTEIDVVNESDVD